MDADKLYTQPVDVKNLADCLFYHTMDLPGHGTIHGCWDLRGNLDAYLGFVDFTGKKVFDAGTASGLLAFEAEKRGAHEVIAFDLARDEQWDHVPYTDRQLMQEYSRTLQEIIADRGKWLEKINNGFWFGHKALRSKVKMCYGNIYNIPEALGPVDISIFGAILLHMRNPLNALEQAAKITRETIIVTDLLPPAINNNQPVSMLIPSPDPPLAVDAWWLHSPALIAQFLRILGYTAVKTNCHIQIHDELNRRPEHFFTVVGTKA
jgi:hypothetical protein